MTKDQREALRQVLADELAEKDWTAATSRTSKDAGSTSGTRASARIFFGAGALRLHAPSARPTLIEARERDRLDERIDARHFIIGTTSVSAAHLMGGCSMGRDATDSVTDSYGRVHGVPWLRVADSSLFPDALQINPYLTIMALADRVASMILQETAEIAIGFPA